MESYSLVDGGGGAAHREWRRHGWETLMVHKVRKKLAIVRSLRELEWREEKGGGEGIRSTRMRASYRVPPKEEKGGRLVWG